MQDLARVDVSDPRQATLVEEEALDRDAGVPRERVEPGPRLRLGDGIRSQQLEARVARLLDGPEYAQQAEAARVLEPELGAVGEPDPGVHVRHVLGRLP